MRLFWFWPTVSEPTSVRCVSNNFLLWPEMFPEKPVSLALSSNVRNVFEKLFTEKLLLNCQEDCGIFTIWMLSQHSHYCFTALSFFCTFVALWALCYFNNLFIFLAFIKFILLYYLTLKYSILGTSQFPQENVVVSLYILIFL